MSREKHAIFLCDLTGIMAQPWINRGCHAWLVDPQHDGDTHDGLVHKVGRTILGAMDILRPLILGGNVVFVAGFPPCTELTSAGAKHWEGKRSKDPYFQAKAAIVLEQCRMIGEMSGAPWIFENPNGAASGIMGQPSFRFDPRDFGGYLPDSDVHPLYPDYLPPRDGYKKRTCVWSGGGFIIPEHKPVVSLDHFPGWALLGGKSQRTKNIRSATPRGFSEAACLANYKGEEND